MSRRSAPGRVAAALVAATLLPACGLGYVLESGYHQVSLLTMRVPLDEARLDQRLNAEQLQAIDRVEDVKAWGEAKGLAPTGSYTSVALDWDRTVYNLAACQPLAFEQKTWWFPITGEVPYLGFFSLEDAEEEAQPLRDEGLDVWVRTVGAWSTLGWFDDPLLPHMLDWELLRLTDTVLHEMTHATVWVAGGVRFNESLASFVGQTAALRYLRDRYGEDSAELRDAQQTQADGQRWVDLLNVLYGELDALYNDPALSDGDKLHRKHELLDSLPRRVILSHLHAPLRYLLAAVEGPWNNARLAQFKDYHAEHTWFQALLDRHRGDLLPFLDHIQRLAEDADDPFEALRRAAEAAP